MLIANVDWTIEGNEVLQFDFVELCSKLVLAVFSPTGNHDRRFCPQVIFTFFTDQFKLGK